MKHQSFVPVASSESPPLTIDALTSPSVTVQTALAATNSLSLPMFSSELWLHLVAEDAV